MTNQFFDEPILNSPYEYPARHWELDADGQPTQQIIDARRRADFITPIPKPRRRRSNGAQSALALDDQTGVSTADQEYDLTALINDVRLNVDEWRKLPNPRDWHVTPETARLLQHWRHHSFGGVRPFFCQVEAVETAIWLTEVAPELAAGRRFLEHLKNANAASNPELMRLALKLATGAGKTTVMAMLIAWQTVNAVRRPGSKHFTRGFLVVTPGITIKDRLRVLQPNDPDAYYKVRELVPDDMLEEINRAKIVITNFHAFKLRDRMELSRGNRALLQGRGPALQTLETEGQMLQRVMPELMSLKNVMVLNDEAHHCYREKPGEDEVAELTGDEKDEAKENNEAARIWISGIEAVNRKLGVAQVLDLSATPFFLRGSGYAEGTLFPWTMSDFSLMDAIESGIVKLPRVPVADNIPGSEIPVYRNLWEHIRADMPRKGRAKAGTLDPRSLPIQLKTALEALYGHYAKTFEMWQAEGIKSPPCFIIVCNNTSASKLVYDYVSGFTYEDEQGATQFVPGTFELFRNHDEYGNAYGRPRTILVDSNQLESGEALDDAFRDAAKDELDRFKRERIARSGDQRDADNITDQDLLREVMNTVGKPDQLGETVRCVVSVSMLTEGWDANTVTHILGVRAFGTQLLCEQVIGRALRRQSYELNDNALFNVEYADVLGIPFDFTTKPVVAPVRPPRETVQVRAVRPDRDHLEIRFPRVQGYRVELPQERLTAKFTDDSRLVLSPALVGPSIVRNEGIIGEGINLTIEHLQDQRSSTILYNLTQHLIFTKWRDPNEEPKLYLFSQLKRIAQEWLKDYLVCTGDTYPGLLMYKELADMACQRITDAIVAANVGTQPVKAVVDPYNPTGSTTQVNFTTSRADRWLTDARKCHLNWLVLDSGWEGEFCRAIESHLRVIAYVKNHNLGLEVPYLHGTEQHRYIPDFVVLVDDGHGEDDPLHLVVEIKGFRGEDAKEKKATMETYWIPGVNNSGVYGRWTFAELTDAFQINADVNALIDGSIALTATRA